MVGCCLPRNAWNRVDVRDLDDALGKRGRDGERRPVVASLRRGKCHIDQLGYLGHPGGEAIQNAIGPRAGCNQRSRFDCIDEESVSWHLTSRRNFVRTSITGPCSHHLDCLPEVILRRIATAFVFPSSGNAWSSI